jgi:hypothetical protein
MCAVAGAPGGAWGVPRPSVGGYVGLTGAPDEATAAAVAAGGA